MTSPHPPRLITERPAGPSRRTIPWLIGIAAVVTGMVWFTLWQIQSIATDNARTPQEAAECIAGMPAGHQANVDEECSTEPEIIWAARHPVRNSAVVFALLLVVGYTYLVLNRGPSRADT